MLRGATVEAENSLAVYLSSLKLLEQHEQRVKNKNKAKVGETRKRAF